MRAFGVREIAAGLLALSPDRHAAALGRVAGDVLDVALLSTALRPGNPRPRGDGCRRRFLVVFARASLRGSCDPGEGTLASRRLRPVGRVIGQCVRVALLLVRLLALARVPFLAVAVVVGAVYGSDQGPDLVVMMASGSAERLISLAVTAVLGWTIWYWARLAIAVGGDRLATLEAHMRAGPAPRLALRVAHALERLVPCLLGSAIFGVLALLARGLAAQEAPALQARLGDYAALMTAAGGATLVLQAALDFLRAGATGPRLLRAVQYVRLATAAEFRRAPQMRVARVLAALGVVAWIVSAAWLVPFHGPRFAHLLGPANVVFAWLAVVVPVCSTLVIYGTIWRFPLLSTVLALLLAGSALEDLYRVRVIRPALAPAGAAVAPAAPTLAAAPAPAADGDCVDAGEGGRLCLVTIDAVPREVRCRYVKAGGLGERLQDWACRWVALRAVRVVAAAGPDGPGPDRRALPVPVVMVSAEGGGIRAGMWAAYVLAGLNDRIRDFGSHVFAMSGVSGGSLGIAGFAAMLADLPDPCRPGGDCRPPQADPMDPTPSLARVHAGLDRDFLSPVLAAFLFTDTVRPLVPLAGRIGIDLATPLRAIGLDPTLDRASALEYSWELAWARPDGSSTFAQALDDLYRRGPGGSPPLLFFNATQIHDGRRAILAPAVVRPLAPPGGAAARAGCPPGEADPGVRYPLLDGFPQAVDIAAMAGCPLRVSTGVALSARFPYVTTVGNLELRRTGVTHFPQYADGGYFDNSGTVTLAEIERHVPAEVELGGTVLSPTVLVLHFVNDVDQAAFDMPEVAAIPAAATSQLLAPFSAILSTRSARSYYAREAMRATALGSTRIVLVQLGRPPQCDGDKPDDDAAPGVPAVRPAGLVTGVAPAPAAAAATPRRVPLGWVMSNATERFLLENADASARLIRACVAGVLAPSRPPAPRGESPPGPPP